MKSIRFPSAYVLVNGKCATLVRAALADMPQAV